MTPHPPVPRPALPDPKTVFWRLDQDRDGKLSLEEFAAGMRLLHRPMGPAFAGPGGPRLPGPPFAPSWPGAAYRPGLLTAAAFKRADANRDGKVSLEEVAPQRREPFKRLLKRADRDGDKALSAEEARRAAAAVRMQVRTPMVASAADGRKATRARWKAAEANEKARPARRPAKTGRKPPPKAR